MLEKYKDELMKVHNKHHDNECHGSLIVDDINLKYKCILILHHRYIGLIEFYIISKMYASKLNAGESPLRYYDYFSVELKDKTL